MTDAPADTTQPPAAAPIGPLTTTPQVQLSQPGHNTSLSIEPVEHELDRKLRLHKEWVLFWFCLLIVVAVLAGCGYALLFTNLSSDDKRNVFSLLTLILGGVVGYFLKK